MAPMVAFWGNISEIIFKALCLICFLLSKFQHEWFSTDRFSSLYTAKIGRDIFGVDCVFKNDSKDAPNCTNSFVRDDLGKFKFWSDHDIDVNILNEIPSSFFIIGTVMFHVLFLLMIADFAYTMAVCFLQNNFYFDRKERFIKRTRWYIFAYIGFFAVSILFYMTIIWVLSTYSHSAIVNEEDGSQLGATFHTFCLSALFFFVGLTSTAITVASQMQDPGSDHQPVSMSEIRMNMHE